MSIILKLILSEVMVGIATAHFPNNQLTHWLKWRLHNDDLCVQLQCRVCDIFIPRHFSRLLTVGDKCQQLPLRINVTGKAFHCQERKITKGALTSSNHAIHWLIHLSRVCTQPICYAHTIQFQFIAMACLEVF